MGQSGSVPALSAEEKVLIQESWAAISPRKKELAAELFQEYFKQWPEDQKMFPHFADVPLDKLGQHPKFRAHATTIMFSLASIVDSMDSEDIIEAIFTKQVTNHSRWNVTLQHFKNLESVFARCFDKYVTREAKEAWIHGFDIFNATAESTLQRLV